MDKLILIDMLIDKLEKMDPHKQYSEEWLPFYSLLEFNPIQLQGAPHW